jgi:hypothetical protein
MAELLLEAGIGTGDSPLCCLIVGYVLVKVVPSLPLSPIIRDNCFHNR